MAYFNGFTQNPTAQGSCKCPDCDADISSNYAPEENGLAGSWSCDACEIEVSNDDDDSGECPEMDD